MAMLRTDRLNQWSRVNRFVRLLLLIAVVLPSPALAADRIPIIYSTDLFQPHDDPDDHYDLATLFALEEFDIRGIIVEHGAEQAQRPGRIPVEQMMHLTGRTVRHVVGLNPPLKSAEDPARDQPEEYQAGVELILDVLRTADRQVTIVTTGSMRDVAAAFNREPQLLRDKVDRLYMNIGNSSGRESEWNVELDVQAYLRVLQSDLPIYWCPCFGEPYGTYWKFRQGDVLETAPPELVNFFLFALTTGRDWQATPRPATDDPIGFLAREPNQAARHEVWQRERHMWCTAPFFHAAGRRIVEMAPGRWVAEPAGPSAESSADPYDFVPGRVVIKEQRLTEFHPAESGDDAATLRAFRVVDPDRYRQIMTSCLKELFKDFPLAAAPR
jgi:hypothetical protein